MILRIVREQPLAVVGGVIVLLLLLTGIFADFIAPYGMNDMVLADRLDPPSATHILGTDQLGRDLFSRIVYGARISMYVGLGAPAIALVLSTVIGCISGYFGGRADMVIQRFVDAIMCFPGLIIMLTVIAITGPGLIQVILVLGILGGIGGQVRVVRSAVMSIRGTMYVDAAKAVGSSDAKTLLRHILPNIMAPIIIIFTTSMGGAILTEATLSFLGYGVPPPEPSWGGMLSREARVYMEQAPWLALWPGLALAAVVWGINMLGDGLRDVLDPRLTGGRTGRYKTKVIKKPVAATQEK
ncbi:MAG: ABC transporter permease [Dehalococcoidia bacterium]|nr:ABC transporter permease [Dehalococcoidia bacterium]